jgi:CUG-BP- and ETR3-like factor
VNEDTLKQLFSAYGLVTESKILMDKIANKPKGCGFITYADKHGAETAIATLHEKYTLPGSSRPLIVRYSTKQLASGKDGETGPIKLYISNLSKQTTEEEIRNMFSQYGQLIDDVVILKDQMSGISKGVAFVRYNSRAEALNAIQALNEQIRDKDAANLMQVKFAHTASEKKQLLQKQLGGLSIGPNGHHMHHGGAGAQMGGYYPAHFNPAYAAQQGYNPYAMPQHMGGYHGGYHGGPMHHGGAPHGAPGPHSGPPHHSHRAAVTKGPEGANLFVYGIPESYTDADLSGMFANFGHVINGKVYRDLATGKSKGFGFVSYDSVASAQQACASMDGYLIMGKKMTVKPKTENNNNQHQQGGASSGHQQQQHDQHHQQQRGGGHQQHPHMQHPHHQMHQQQPHPQQGGPQSHPHPQQNGGGQTNMAMMMQQHHQTHQDHRQPPQHEKQQYQQQAHQQA